MTNYSLYIKEIRQEHFSPRAGIKKRIKKQIIGKYVWKIAFYTMNAKHKY